MWVLTRQLSQRTQAEDSITWKLTYTAASAYKAQFIGCVKEPNLQAIWDTWAIPKCKLFTWLILQNRVWTSVRLATRGWDHSPTCPLCRNTMETARHLLADCRYTKRIWSCSNRSYIPPNGDILTHCKSGGKRSRPRSGSPTKLQKH